VDFKKLLASLKNPKKALFAALGVPVAVLAILRFLPSRRAQFVLLACLLGIVALVLLVQFLFRLRAKAKARAMYQSLDAQYQQAASVSPEEERARVEQIRQRFADAVQELRHTGKTIYDLPWYLLIGEPQSGKSMTLRGSDLNFPIGTDKLSGLGGTQNCDWWFTNQAVILDTAGRFTFQEAGAPDRAEWEGFLDLIARRRRQCPINGVIVVIPTDALLNDPPEMRKEKAKNMHAKLGELQRKLGVQFPVFVLITKCDLVLGFSEFFRSFGEVDAAQLIGWSNDGPFDQPYDAASCERQFQALYERLAQKRLELLREPVSLEERGLAFAFPEELRALAAPLQQYLGTMFAADIYRDPLFFRGFYFTSGMQEGQPIVNIGREVLGGPSGAEKREFDPLGSLFPSRPFFIADFYKEKALRERGMVFRSSASMKRAHLLKRWTYVGGAALSLLLAAILIFGGLRVQRFIRAPLSHARDARNTVSGEKNPPPDAQAVSKLLNELDDDTTALGSRGWSFRLTFPFRSVRAPVDDLRRIRDALFASKQLHPATEQVETLLADSQQWQLPKERRLLESLKEYALWYTGHAPAPDGSVERAEAFDRLYLPVQEQLAPIDDYDALRGRFQSMSVDFQQVRYLVFPPEEKEAGHLENAVDAAGDYFGRAHASRESAELSPWIQLLDASEALARRYGELLALAPELGKVETVAAYDDVVLNRWRAAYQTAAADLPGFLPAREKLIEQRQKLEREIDATGAGSPVVELQRIEDDKIRELWNRTFGTAGLHYGDSLIELVQSSELLALETQGRLVDRMKGVVQSLDDRLEKLISNEIERRRQKLEYLYAPDAASTGQRKLVSDVLAALDSALDPQPSAGAAASQPGASASAPSRVHRAARVGSTLDQWVAQISATEHPDVSRARKLLTPPAADAESDEPAAEPRLSDKWEPARLGELVAKADLAVQKHVLYNDLAHIIALLADPEHPLETRRAGATDTVDPNVVGYADLQKRFTGGFLRETLDAIEAIEAAVHDTSATPLRDDQPHAVGERTVQAFDTAVRSYAERYFAAWGEAYPSQLLADYPDLMRTRDWQTYYERLEDQSKVQQIVTQARRCLTTVVDSVLSVENRGPEPPELGDYQKTLRRQHGDLLLETRRATPRCGQQFDSLARRIANTYKHPADQVQIEGRDWLLRAPQYFGDLGISARDVEKPDRWDAARDSLPDLDTQNLRALQEKFPDEHILRQLDNLARRGRYCLNVTLDQNLRRLLEESGEVYSPAYKIGAFPFKSPAPAGKPDEIAQRPFEEFLRDMLRFKTRFTAIQQTEETLRKKYEPDDAEVGRLEFLDRAAAWSRLIYGDGDQGQTNLGNGSPKPVLFEIQYVEPRQGIVDQYGGGELLVGLERDDLGQATVPTPTRFRTDRRRSPDPPDSRVWVLGRQQTVSLALTDPVVGRNLSPRVPLESVTIPETVWAVPLFIYRFLAPDQFAEVVEREEAAPPERTLWYVRVPVPPAAGNNRVLLFRLHLKSCAAQGDCPLPPPIGWFTGDTQEPTPWPVGPEYAKP